MSPASREARESPGDATADNEDVCWNLRHRAPPSGWSRRRLFHRRPPAAAEVRAAAAARRRALMLPSGNCRDCPPGPRSTARQAPSDASTTRRGAGRRTRWACCTASGSRRATHRRPGVLRSSRSRRSSSRAWSGSAGCSRWTRRSAGSLVTCTTDPSSSSTAAWQSANTSTSTPPAVSCARARAALGNRVRSAPARSSATRSTRRSASASTLPASESV